MFVTLVILLGAIAIAVPASRYLGLGSILGYLVAGAVIGPSGFGLITNVGEIGDVSALGVTMLLFLIGLELRPHRLWILRKAVFGMGLGQMLPTALLIACLTHLAGIAWPSAIVLGIGLALSSTAIVLPMLTERKLLPSVAGRDSFAVLLFQDMAAIPVLALEPLLAGAHVSGHAALFEFVRGLAVIAAILVGGSFLVRPLFRMVGYARSPEVFTATALLLVVGTAALADWAGLSASLGAFMAGVLVSDSEYRHELQADIEPFEGLLLGFFFMSVGMSADLSLSLHHPLLIIALVLGLVALKALIAFGVSYFRRRLLGPAIRFALALPEGSEFSFVLFASAVATGALDRQLAEIATLVVALSMMLTPVLFAGSERFILPRIERRREPVFDAQLEKADNQAVIICGFGRFGQIIGRVLTMQRIAYVALDKSQEQVDIVRRFGNKVYFGDPAREEVMRAAGAEQARVLVIALDDMEESLKVAQMVRRKFPHLHVLARARNRRHVHLLMGAGVEAIVRETFYSSLRLTELLLERLDVPHAQAARAIALFREHDERMLDETYAIAGDEKQLIQTSQEATQELMDLFESDQSPESITGPGQIIH
jgi:CPA2 family monovalent cation:H+ antiporter-2/glutathione-regulated potassium-efflux system protein KefB